VFEGSARPAAKHGISINTVPRIAHAQRGRKGRSDNCADPHPLRGIALGPQKSWGTSRAAAFHTVRAPAITVY